MSWKHVRYYAAPQPGPHRPLPEEIAPHTHGQLRAFGRAVTVFGLGVILGIWVAPEAPRELKKQLTQAQARLAERSARVGELEQAQRLVLADAAPGALPAGQRAHLEREGRRYGAALTRSGAQAAGNLIAWFMQRWLQLLDRPQAGDRTGRRAAALSLLVGGMSQNLNPRDYVPWQSEFLGGQWLPELHFDQDGDGLPGPRRAPNRFDGFANESVCHIAMALNQAMRDAQVLVMPELHCDRPDSRMSVFLQGTTLDDALTEFIRALRAQGFVVVEHAEKGQRLVLLGPRPPAPAND